MHELTACIKRTLKVLELCCERYGLRVHGVQWGDLGDLELFSRARSKHATTLSGPRHVIDLLTMDAIYTLRSIQHLALCLAKLPALTTMVQVLPWTS